MSSRRCFKKSSVQSRARRRSHSSQRAWLVRASRLSLARSQPFDRAVYAAPRPKRRAHTSLARLRCQTPSSGLPKSVERALAAGAERQQKPGAPPLEAGAVAGEEAFGQETQATGKPKSHFASADPSGRSLVGGLYFRRDAEWNETQDAHGRGRLHPRMSRH